MFVPGLSHCLKKAHIEKKAAVKSAAFFMESSLVFCCFLDAGNGIQASRIANIGQTLADHFGEKFAAVAQIHVSLCMGNELWFTAALGC